jgi:hypothetical protein
VNPAPDAPATSATEAWESPAFRRAAPPTPQTLSAELLAMAELNAILERLEPGERTRAVLWAAHKFGVAQATQTAAPAPQARATTRQKAAPKAAAPKAPKTPKTPKAPKAPKTPKAPKAPAAKKKAAKEAPSVDGKALAQVVARQRPSTDVERLLVVAAFLVERGLKVFGTRDLTGAHKAAGGDTFTNASATVAVAVRRKLLARSGQRLTLTPAGTQVVRGLPHGKRK